MYHALEDADNTLRHTHDITQLMDCKGGLDKLDADIYKPRHTMDTDMDLVMAYKELESQTKHTI